MNYAVAVLQAALMALERIGVDDQRVAQLRAAIELLRNESRSSIGALLGD